MYQAMATELAGETRSAVLAAKDELKKPLFAQLARFADTLPSGDALGLLQARKEGYRQMLGYLRSLDDGSGMPDPPFVDLVYRWALDYCEWGTEWCERQERRLRRAA